MTDPRFLQNGFDKRLSHAMEECGEFICAAAKIQRWGPNSYNPDLPPKDRESNLVWLKREMQDVKQTIERLEQAIEEEFS